MVLIVFGLPGSGKSYFASRLARKIDADYVNSDQLRREMFPERIYSEQEKAAVYDAMLVKMKTAVSLGRDIILDATFYKNETRSLFEREIRGKDKLLFIELRAAESTTRERLKETRPFSEADFKVYKLLKEKWEPMREQHLLLRSTNDNIDGLLQQAIEYLKHENDQGTSQQNDQ